MTGIFAIPFIVFIVSTSFFFPFITGKNFTFRIIVEIIFALWLVLALRDPSYRPTLSGILASLGAFVGIIALADIFSAYPFKSVWSNFERMEGLVALVHLLMYFVVLGAMMRTKQIWDWFLHTSVGVSVIIALYGFMQLAGKLTIHQGGVRLDATFGNATYLAVYMLFHLFLTAYLFTRWRGENWMRYLYGIAMLFQGIILYHTATRGSILGFIGGALLTALLIALFEREHVRIRTIAIGIVVGVGILIAGFFALKNTDFVQESPVLSRFASISLEADGNTRFILWGFAYKGFLERPILGWGQENFNVVFNKYYDPRLYAQEQWFDRVHNIFLDWLIAGGVLGLLSYLAIPIVALYLLWFRRETDMTVVQKSIFTGLFAGYFFHNLFVFDNLTSYIYYIIVLAYIHTLVSEEAKEESILMREIDPKLLQTIVIPAVIVAMLAIGYFFNAKGMKTASSLLQAISVHGLEDGGLDRNLEFFKEARGYNSLGRQEVVEQLTRMSMRMQEFEQVPLETRQAFLVAASEEIEQLVVVQPGDARLHLFAASFYRNIGLYDDALRHLEVARVLTPRKQTVLFEMGSVYVAQDRLDRAFEVLEEAYLLETRSSQSRVNYAVGASYIGRVDIIDEMVEALFADFDEKGGELLVDDRLIQAYLNVSALDKIITLLEGAIARVPDNAQFRVSLAATYDEAGQLPRAIEVLEQAIVDIPAFAEQGRQFIEQLKNGAR